MRYTRQASFGFCLFALLALLPVAPRAGDAIDRSLGNGAPIAQAGIASERVPVPHGHPETLFALGMVYEYGHGVAVDPYRAAQYYYQAAALYAARGAHHHFLTCRDALRRLNPDHPYLRPLSELIEARRRPA